MTSLATRFWKKVSIAGIGDCWPWLAYRDQSNYGQFRGAERLEYAHRTAWSLVRGVIPSNLCVLHKCDNPPCCNPEHLFLGTRTDNARDKVEKGRQARGKTFSTRLRVVIPKGESHYAAKLMAKAVREIRATHVAGDRIFGSTSLADKYGVTRRAIGMVVSRERWNHLKD